MNFTYIFELLLVPSVLIDIFNMTIPDVVDNEFVYNELVDYELVDNELVDNYNYSSLYDEFFPVGEYYYNEYDDYIELS